MSTIAEPPVETGVVTESKYPLILSGTGYGLEIDHSYIKRRDDLIARFSALGDITDPEQDRIISELIAEASEMRIVTEKGRKAVKQPALEFGRDTDEKASAFISPLAVKEQEAKKKRGDYAIVVQQERQRVLAEMEAARQAEAKRLADEAAAAAKAEAARIAAEQAAFDATTPEEDAAAEKAAADAKAAELARLEAAAKVQAVVTTPAFVPEAVKGVKMVADYTIEDIDALYRWNVGLVTLTERRKEILETIARQTIGDTLPSIPGLRVFLKPQVR